VPPQRGADVQPALRPPPRIEENGTKSRTGISEIHRVLERLVFGRRGASALAGGVYAPCPTSTPDRPASRPLESRGKNHPDASRSTRRHGRCPAERARLGSRSALHISRSHVKFEGRAHGGSSPSRHDSLDSSTSLASISLDAFSRWWRTPTKPSLRQITVVHSFVTRSVTG